MAKRMAGLVLALVIAAGIWLFVATMVTVVLTIGIWPGEAKLTAPLLCPDDQPDAFVVSDTYQPSPGDTSTTYTLYCMGPGGERTDQGFLRPFLALTVAHGLLLAVPAVPLLALRRRRRPTRARRGAPPSPIS